MPPVSRGTSSAYLNKLFLLCGPAKLRRSGISECFLVLLVSRRRSNFSRFMVFIMSVHVNLYGEALANFLQHNEAQREQRPQPLIEQRLKPAAGAAAALAQVEGVFRVAVSCFVFVVLLVLSLF